MSGDTAKRWIPTSVVSSVGIHCHSTAADSTICVNGTREDDDVGRSTTVGNVVHPDRHNPTRPRFRNDKHMIGVAVSEKVRLYNQAITTWSKCPRLNEHTLSWLRKISRPRQRILWERSWRHFPKRYRRGGCQLVSRLRTTNCNERCELCTKERSYQAVTWSILSTIYYENVKRLTPSAGNSSPARCVHQTYPWNWSVMLLVSGTYRNKNGRWHRNQRKVHEYNFPSIGSIIKTGILSRDRHTTAQPCIRVIIISVVAVIIICLAILLTTSPRWYNLCPGAALLWEARNYSNDTTILNVSEVMAVLLLCEE